MIAWLIDPVILPTYLRLVFHVWLDWLIHWCSDSFTSCLMAHLFDLLLFRYQDVALSSSYRGKLNEFSKVEGGQKRISEWRTHFQEQWHQDCVNQHRRHQLTQEGRAEENPFTPYLAKRKRELRELSARLILIGLALSVPSEVQLIVRIRAINHSYATLTLLWLILTHAEMDLFIYFHAKIHNCLFIL